MRGVELVDVDINGEIENVTINGVDVGPLVEAELDRRDPDRAKMRPTDPAGFREAWDIVERLWAGTVERARRLDPELLHESVDGEWSFIETLRHLVVRHRLLGPAGDPRRPGAVGPARPAVGRDAGHPGRARATATCAPVAGRGARAAPRPDGHRARRSSTA